MPNNNTNTSSTLRPFPNAYLGQVVTADTVNSNVILSSKNVDIGTNGTETIMTVKNNITGEGDTATNITDINLNNLMIVRKNITGTGATAITTEEIKLTSSDISIGKNGSSQPVIEIDGTNISFKNNRIQDIADAVNDDDALSLGQLNAKLAKISKAINNLSMSIAVLGQSHYGDHLTNSPALAPYTITHLPSTNVNAEGNTNIPTITLDNILALT
jgi:hypothetical protein